VNQKEITIDLWISKYTEMESIYVSLHQSNENLVQSHENLTQRFEDFKVESKIQITDAYERGNTSGYASGTITGYAEGKEEGYVEGYVEGNETGYILGLETGERQGYSEGVEVGARGDYEGWGCFVKDPTYDEVKSFVRKDTTDRLRFARAHDFSATFKNNAYESGYRCFYVWIYFRDGTHAIVGFNTTDRGIVYVDPQTDEFVKNLRVGVDFDDLISDYYLAGDSVIEDFGYMW